jgi:hypothetical protein
MNGALVEAGSHKLSPEAAKRVHENAALVEEARRYALGSDRAFPPVSAVWHRPAARKGRSRVNPRTAVDSSRTENFVALIPFRRKTTHLGTILLEQVSDFLLWYAKRNSTTMGSERPNISDYTFHEEWRVNFINAGMSDHSLLPPGAKVFRLKSLEPGLERGMWFTINRTPV